MTEPSVPYDVIAGEWVKLFLRPSGINTALTMATVDLNAVFTKAKHARDTH